MLATYWLKRSGPVLFLAAAIVLAGGNLQSVFAASSVGQPANSASPAVGTAASLAVGAAAPLSADVSNRPEKISRHRGAAGGGDDWVRTRTGWEREARWFAATSYEPALHPAVVAGLVSLVALWALVAFPADAVRSTDDREALDTTFTTDSQETF